MYISELKKANLQKLIAMGCAAEVSDLANRELYTKWSFFKERAVDVTHRGLAYTVGRWSGWEGEYWVVECRTGIIFRKDSVKDLRDIISLCSASYYEPNEVR